MCNDFFFSRQIAHTAKQKGLRIIWSSEMMWHHAGELDAVKAGLVDTILYTSEFQKSVLKPNYDKCSFPLKEYVVPNYIDPDDFPFFERSKDKNGLTIGRISRADLAKYPENFPLFYEHLQLTNPKFMVMAWSNILADKYSWHTFDSRWKFFSPNEITVQNFLSQIDMFVYPLGHNFRESWGRSTVEAMLTGCPVVVPYGHHFVNLINHGYNGFMYKTYEECRDICRLLERNPDLRIRIGLAARKIRNILNPIDHINMWKEVFNV
jgi:glycosyltransferase involved in cell wall biosynthesis